MIDSMVLFMLLPAQPRLSGNFPKAPAGAEANPKKLQTAKEVLA